MPSSIVLLPPLLVLMCAFITRRLNISLALGIISSALIASEFNIKQTAYLLGSRIIHQLTDADYLYLYAFLLLIGMLIFLINKTGGATGFAHAITKHIRSKRAAEMSSLLLSCALFIDDYLSNLTVGYVMRPLTDTFKIPRVKLAFLVHSLSGPLVILMPVTSWVAMITSQLNLAGIGVNEAFVRIIADPFFIYINTIPYIFYSLVLIAAVFFIVRKKISFGPMAQQELYARTTGNLFGGKKELNDPLHEAPLNGSLLDLIFPLGFLLTSVFLSILYAGGFSWLGGTRTLLQALQNNTNTFCALFVSALITLVCSYFFGLVRNKINHSDARSIIASGIKLMWGAVLMVLLASTLGTMFKTDLQVGAYIASSIARALPLALLPASIFIVSTIIATVTGSSWGTIAIMTPVTIQMLTTLLQLTDPVTPEQIVILLPLLGAVFSGAVCGDHISPISETTIMASTSAGCYPMDHTITQFYYTIPVIISTCIAFVIAGYVCHLGTIATLSYSLGCALTLCLSLLWLLNKKCSR